MPGVWKSLTVGTTAVLALGSSHIRTTIVIYNTSSNAVYWGHDASLAAGQSGPIAQNQAVILQDCDNDQVHAPIYLIALQSGNDVRVYECAADPQWWRWLRELR